MACSTNRSLKSVDSRFNETICSMKQGKLKGDRELDQWGTPFLSFFGVPYAKPPLGLLRFKDPLPADNWDGIRNATKDDNPCFSINNSPEQPFPVMVFYKPEDCLYLNVFTRQLQRNGVALKPVLVFIPGGFFMKNVTSRCFFGPEYLLSEEIVLVTITYRLGILGFLSLDDPALEIPGNAGLKDIVQALRWVRNNIKQFGGDPENITIFGQDSGGDAVHYLVLSPLAKGLFHKAIIQSGGVLNPGAYSSNSKKLFLEVLHFQETSERKILEFLRRLPYGAVAETLSKMDNSISPSKKRHFGPCIEVKSDKAFIYEQPVKLLDSGDYNQVPMIMGYNNLDGHLEHWCKYTGFNPNTDNFLPFYFGYATNDTRYKELNKTICQFYFGRNMVDRNQPSALFDVLGDALFIRGTILAAKAHVKTSKQPVYLYRLSVNTHYSYFKNSKRTGSIGASHGDDLVYLFNIRSPHMIPGCIEENTIRRFASMWSNFAKSGVPIPEPDPLLMDSEWLPFTETERRYLEISIDLELKENPENDRMEFWDGLSKGQTFKYN